MLLVFITQIFSEFFPISSSLLLKTLNMGSESMVFHIFSGLLFIIIHFRYIRTLLLKPVQNIKTIMFYIMSAIPSIVIGYYTDMEELITLPTLSIEYSIIFNICGACLLLILIHMKKKVYYYNKKEYSIFTVMDGFYMGCFASLNAFFPGLSRLGMCLTYLLIKNKNISKSYEVAIISSIPILMGKPLVLIYKDPYISIILLDFIMNFYGSIILCSCIILYLHTHLKEILSLRFIKIICLLRIIYYGIYLLYIIK